MNRSSMIFSISFRIMLLVITLAGLALFPIGQVMGAGNSASMFVNPVSIFLAYNPASTYRNGTTTVSYVLTNGNADIPATGVTFQHAFPELNGGFGPQLSVNSPLEVTNTCGGTLTDISGSPLAANQRSMKLTGGSIPANSTCTITIKLIGGRNGGGNTTGPVTSNEGGTGAPSNRATIVFGLLTAADVAVSGRLLTSEGRPVRRATVRLTDADGGTRIVNVRSDGAFRFEGIPSGETYRISASSARFNFSPVIINLTDELTGLELRAQP